MRGALVASALAGVAFVAACSSDSSSSTTTDGQSALACAPHDASGVDLKTPVSFRADVAPVLQKSCGLSSSCHAGSRDPNLADASALRDAIVGRASSELPSMPYVTAGDPARSFLLRKIDGDQCALDAQCAGGSCGGSMPYGAPLLDAASRDALRRWIAQGARDD